MAFWLAQELMGAYLFFLCLWIVTCLLTSMEMEMKNVCYERVLYACDERILTSIHYTSVFCVWKGWKELGMEWK
jgi:hypothetical protein